MSIRPASRSPARDGPGLRLPPFEELGIAAPHPDVYLEPLDAHCAGSSLDVVPRTASPFTGLKPDFTLRHPLGNVGALTPPAEHGEPQWHSLHFASTPSMHSPDTDPGKHASSSNSAVAGEEQSTSPASATALHVQFDTSSTPKRGIDGAIDVVRRNIQRISFPVGSLRVLSHALPCPSASGYAYPDIIGSIHDSTPSSPTVWINVFHAVPGRFNLADLPTSPPVTPGPAIGGEDYFTQKVFDSAVPVADYLDDLRSLPRSPRPVVPPSSINVSVVERYIPPTSANEFADMFKIGSSSILLDRLIELSPLNGTLMFVYPTKRGGETFMREYLGPVIDPLLRSMVVINALSSDLSVNLGRMPAVAHLQDHKTLERKMRHLCARLSQHTPDMERLHDKKANFQLSFASTQEVMLEREVWAKHWWGKQEKSRIREALHKYVQEAQARMTNDHVERMGSPTALMQQLLEGVAKRPYPPGQCPKTGVEVSVFVISRTE